MAKVAFLIGVSDYQISGNNQGFTDLPSAKLDVEGIKRILEDPNLGAFDHVETLINPESHYMARCIENFLDGCQKNDLVLLYFSGHGAKDETRKLYFAAKGTEKNAKDRLITATAVSAQFVKEKLDYCKATKKIMILDCCFSGAIDPNAKGDDTLEVLEKSLSAVKGSIILTSSSSTEISYGDPSQMSFYTRYLVQGIESGEADRDANGHLSINELHNYVKDKLQVEKTGMNPKIFFLQEDGFYSAPLIKVPITDPRQVYRKKVKGYVDQGYAKQGEFDRYMRDVLKKEQIQINQLSKTQLSISDAKAIEDEFLKPIKQRLSNLEEYRKHFREHLQRQSFNESHSSLKYWRERVLQLTNEDVAEIEQKEHQCLTVPTERNPTNQLSTSRPLTRKQFLKWAIPGGIGLVGVTFAHQFFKNQTPPIDYSKLESFLKAKNWKEANEETINLMSAAVNRGRDSLEPDLIDLLQHFPCKVLNRIDHLWVSNSSSKFGFSVQRDIYVDTCGGSYLGSSDRKTWECFEDTVGWRVNNESIPYSLVNFSTQAPQGHLPAGDRDVARFGWVFGMVTYDCPSAAHRCKL